MASPTRLTAAERRAAIIESAIRLFADRGFRGATTRELAAAVGVSEPVLYQHFPSKRDLYKAIIESTMERAHQTYDLEQHGQLAPEAFFRGMAGIMVDFYQQNADYVRLLFYSALERHELSRMFHERHACTHFDYLAGYVRRQIEAGVFRPVDPLMAARMFTGMVADVALKAVLQPDTETPQSREALLDGMVDIFLRGVMRTNA